MIAEAIDLKRELYLSILMDREHGGPVFVASQKVCFPFFLVNN